MVVICKEKQLMIPAWDEEVTNIVADTVAASTKKFYVNGGGGGFKRGGDAEKDDQFFYGGGGGGGGGYYGGGGGAYAGSGGGSSFVTASSTFNAQHVIHTQGFANDHGFLNIVFNEFRFLDVDNPESEIPSAAPTDELVPSEFPTLRPISLPTRRPTTVAYPSASHSPSKSPSRRPTEAPVTSNPTYPIMVPVTAPTLFPSTQDDDHTSCNLDNLKFFNGEAHDDCLKQILVNVFTQIHTHTSTVNYMAEIFRGHVNETTHHSSNFPKDGSTIEAIKQYVDDKVSPVNASVSLLTETFKRYLVESKYKQPTIPPTPAPTRHRRSRKPSNS